MTYYYHKKIKSNIVHWMAFIFEEFISIGNTEERMILILISNDKRTS